MALSRDKAEIVANSRGWMFDVDGTIMDSHEGHYRAWNRTTRAHGRAYDHAQIVRQFGKTTYEIARALLGHLSHEELLAVSDEKAGYFLEEVPRLQLFPRAREVFERLKASGKAVCLASSNVRVVLERVVEAQELGSLVDAYVGLDDISRGKPDPEMILASAKAIGVPADECVVVGDSIYDLQAGKRAGARTVAVLTGGVFSRAELEAQGPDLVLDEVGDLLEYL
ncbi:MAG: HAD family hydrolase [Promethearchaeota archaeon]